MAKNKFPVGSLVRFVGYAENVEEADRVLTEGQVYTVVEANVEGESVAVQVDNPDFNPKRKESENNSKQILVDVFWDEVEAAEEEGEQEEAPAKSAPAKGKAAAKAAPAKGKTTPAKGAGKGKAAQDDEAEDEDEDEDEGNSEDVDAGEDAQEEEAPPPKARTKSAPAKTTPAKTATAKGKAAAKAAPAKSAPAKGKNSPAKAAPAKEETDELPALENEDEDILALVEESENVLELAAELVEDSAALDYRLGGVLYHVRLSGAYKALDKAYAENGGFGLYVKEHLNIEYRKAMYLIDIYYKFNLYGVDAAKVQELGWTKCSKIAAVMTENNAEELLELAEGATVSELSDTIKASYAVKGQDATGGERRKKVAFKFRLWDDQADVVTQVLQQAQGEMGHKDLSDTFERIVMEWAVEHGVEVKEAKKVKASAKAATKAGAAPAKASGRRATAQA